MGSLPLQHQPEARRWDPNEGFSGRLLDLLDDLVRTYYPSLLHVRHYQEWLLAEIRQGLGPFPCRHFAEAVTNPAVKADPKVNYFETDLPFPIIACDNEPTTSFFAACRAGEVLDGESMLSCLQGKRICAGLSKDGVTTMLTKAKFKERGIPFAFNNHDKRLALAGLKACHVADAAKNLDAARPASLRDELEVRIFRTMSPVNVFPFPNKSVYSHQLEGVRYTDLGEVPGIQELFAAVIQKHLESQGGGNIFDAWFRCARPPFALPNLASSLSQFSDATVVIRGSRESLESEALPKAAPDAVEGAGPKFLVAAQSLRRLNAIVLKDAALAQKTKFVLHTASPGWRFEVEYPTQAKLLELLGSVSAEVLPVRRVARSGRAKGAAQYKTQFGSCYLVQTSAWSGEKWNYLE